MRKIKKSLAFLLTLIMIFTCNGMTTYASEVPDESQGTEATVETPVEEEKSDDASEVDNSEATESTEAVTENVEEVETEAVLNAAAPASEEENDIQLMSTTSIDGYKYSIVMVDCGRKYFSVSSLETIIDSAASAGMNCVMLGVGNDGMRFLLDDMSITVNGTTYTSDQVSTAIHNGNEAYSNFTVDELTQDDMNTLMTYAAKKGVEIIPMIESPGHMDAILDAAEELSGKTCSYNGSGRTIDVTNSTAVAFTKAILQKYIDYFKAAGCTMFNMGCDEYANDIYTTGGMGFGNLTSYGKYSYFVTYVNEIAAMVEDAGMTPMAFNDGIYYNQNTSGGTFDTNIVVLYWSAGWNGYSVASASYLNSKGFKMINADGTYYWVLGADKNRCSTSTADGFVYSDFQGSTDTVQSNQIGAMFLIWCDDPTYYTDSYIATNTADVISHFGATLPQTSSRSVNKAVESTKADPVTISITGDTTADASGCTVTVEKLTDVTVEKLTDAAEYVVYEITPYVNGEAYEGEATVSLPIPEGWDTSKVYAFVVNADKSVTTIKTGKVENGCYIYTAPHFSEQGLALASATPATDISYDKEIDLTVGETKTETQSKVNNQNNTDTTNYDSNIATVTVNGTDAQEGKTTYESVSVNPSNIATKTSWTKTSYYYTTDNKNYYPVYAYYKKSSGMRGTTTYYWGYSKTDSSKDVTSISSAASSFWGVDDITLYQVSGTTAATDASTTITIVGKTVGTTYYTVGDTTYKIVVSKTSQDVTLAVDGSASYTDTTASTAVSSDTSVVTASASGNTLTLTGKKVGTATVETTNCTYKVTVQEEDLSTVTPLKIEYWVTNAQVTPDSKDGITVKTGTGTNTGNSSYTYYYSEISATAALNTANGVSIKDLLATTGKGNGNTVCLWKGRVITGGAQQDNAGGKDLTFTEGYDDFQYIRYYNKSWSYSNDGTTWTAFPDSCQVVAYYLQKTTVTQAVDTLVKDWGLTKDDSASWFNWSSSWALSFAAVYDTGMEPSESNLLNTTTFYNGDDGRNIGYLTFNNTSDYEVYKVTVTYGTRTASASSQSVSYNLSSNTTETTVWEEGDSDQAYVNGNEHTDYCTWDSTNSAILVRIYVREVVKEDTLKVVYQLTDGTEFYSLDINTKEGVNFDGYVSNDQLVKTTIENSVGNTQTITTNLKDTANLPNMPSKYKNGNYNYTKAQVSDDNKTLYLIYKGTNTKTFVYDFGLGMQITASDIVGSDNASNVKSMTAADAKNCTTSASGTTITAQVEAATVTAATFTANVTFDDNTTGAYDIFMVPATSVYYEEGFATLTGFTEGSKGNSYQNVAEIGKDTNNYGYDSAYTSNTGNSDGTVAVSSTKGNTATFEFTGTGVDIYTNNDKNSGTVVITVASKSGTAEKMLIANTATTDGKTDNLTVYPEGDLYNEVIASVSGLTYGTHIVTIKTANAKEFSLDGFRVYGTASSTSIYNADNEDNPTFIQVRDLTLALGALKSENSDMYASDIYEQVYTKADASEVTLATITSAANATVAISKDLVDNGQKNEIFLWPGMTLTLNVQTDREVQLGLMGAQGSVNCSISTNSAVTSVSTVDMFYTIHEMNAAKGTVTITNTSKGENDILCVTKLKVSDDPNPLGEITEENIADTLTALGYGKVSYADATASISLVDYTGKVVASTSLTENGVEGEDATFAAADIQATAESVLPSGYGFADASVIADQTVAYGEDGAVKIQVGKVATLKITYKKLFGKTLGTATLTHVQTSKTSKYTFTTNEIKAAAPSGAKVISLAGTSVNYGKSKSITATCR